MKAITPQGAVQQMESLIMDAGNIRCYDDVVMALNEADQLVRTLAEALDRITDIALFEARRTRDDELVNMYFDNLRDLGVKLEGQEVR
jgi:hypothetical protein